VGQILYIGSCALIIVLSVACGGTTVAGDQCKPGCDGNIPFTCTEDGQPKIGIPCGDGASCTQGVCVATTSLDTTQSDVPCEPLCTNKGGGGVLLECGDDGCGGSCGECNGGDECVSGLCIGDTCVPNCDNGAGQLFECGADDCGGTCGECVDGKACDEGFCACAPNCEGNECGDDGCGGTCGNCTGDDMEDYSSACVSTIQNSGGKHCVPLGDHCKNAIELQNSVPASGSFTDVTDLGEGLLGDIPSDHHALTPGIANCKMQNTPSKVPDQVWKYTATSTCTYRLNFASMFMPRMWVLVTKSCPDLDTECVAAKEFAFVSLGTPDTIKMALEKGETYYIIVEPGEGELVAAPYDIEIKPFEDCGPAIPGG